MRKTFCHTKRQGVWDKNISLLKYKNFCFFFRLSLYSRNFWPTVLSVCSTMLAQKRVVKKSPPTWKKSRTINLYTHHVVKIMQQCHIEIVMMGTFKPDFNNMMCGQINHSSFEKFSFHSPEISSLSSWVWLLMKWPKPSWVFIRRKID